MRRLTFLILIVGLVGGCAFQMAADAERAKTELIGFSRAELFSCAGVPVRQATESGLEYLVYNSEGSSPVAGSTYAAGKTAFFGGVVKKRYCEATFILKDGVVTKINYTGITGGLGTKGYVCFTIIENCLKK